MSTITQLPNFTTYLSSMSVLKPLRFRTSYFVLLAISLIGLFSFTTMIFLPDLRETGAGRVYKVYDDFKKAGPDLLLPPPPRLENGPFKRADHVVGNEDVHVIGDRAKLKEKIERDFPLNVLEEPLVDVGKKSGTTESGKKIAQDSGDVAVPVSKRETYSIANGSADKFSETRQKQEKVKEMMKHAWDGYVKYAWGSNELQPITKRGHTSSIFGGLKGATIVDAMDTLYIMNLTEEFNLGREWIKFNLDAEPTNLEVSVFEVTIRYLGGLLTCYSFTGDILFRDKATAIADRLLPAFDTTTGIPYALVNLNTGKSRNYGWASGGCSILSEFGSLYLEFFYLSEITGKSIYKEKVEHILNLLDDIDKIDGLYPNYLNPLTRKWGSQHVSIGSLGDSYYEYLLKIWIQSNKKNTKAKRMFEDAMDAILDKMLFVSPEGLVHFSELRSGKPEHKMEHLACFSGGLLGLAAHTLNTQESQRYMSVGKDITHTCHESYDRTKVKLGPEGFRFRNGMEAKTELRNEKVYILRPEVIESYFYMYRLTKEQKYRDWGWEAVLALEKHCRVQTGGYTGLSDVYDENSRRDDVQQSFFLAETLKYLYLLFSDDDVIPLEKWVFNTEAHPLPIKEINSFYRPKSETN